MTDFFQHLTDGIAQGSIYALIALGYTMVYGVLRFINFAHGELFMVGAFAGAVAGEKIAAKFSGQSCWFGACLVFVIAMTVAALLGMVIERVAYRPLRNRPKINVLITAIGVSLLLQNVMQIIFGATPRAFPDLLPGVENKVFEIPYSLSKTGFFLVGAGVVVLPALIATVRYGRKNGAALLPVSFRALVSPAFLKFAALTAYVAASSAGIGWLFRTTPGDRLTGSVLVSVEQTLAACATVVLLIALACVIRFTKTGLALRALAQNRQAATLMGVNEDRVISFTFALGSALAAAGGVLYAMNYQKADPYMGMMPGVKAFVAAVLGGIGSLPGAVVGALVLGLSENFCAANETLSSYRDGIAFAILIVLLLFRPAGLLGKIEREKV